MIRAALVPVLALALLPSAARATTLVNDPAHPFAPRAFATMQAWNDHAHMPTPRGQQTISNAPCPVVGPLACSSDGQTWRPAANITEEVYFHEIGRIVNDRLDDSAKAGLDAQFHVNHWAANYAADYHRAALDYGAGENISADAYAECAMRSHWSRWWLDTNFGHMTHDGPDGVSGVGGTRPASMTVYPFRPGPRRFARVCAIYRSAV